MCVLPPRLVSRYCIVADTGHFEDIHQPCCSVAVPDYCSTEPLPRISRRSLFAAMRPPPCSWMYVSHSTVSVSLIIWCDVPLSISSGSFHEGAHLPDDVLDGVPCEGNVVNVWLGALEVLVQGLEVID